MKLALFLTKHYYRNKLLSSTNVISARLYRNCSERLAVVLAIRERLLRSEVESLAALASYKLRSVLSFLSQAAILFSSLYFTATVELKEDSTMKCYVVNGLDFIHSSLYSIFK